MIRARLLLVLVGVLCASWFVNGLYSVDGVGFMSFFLTFGILLGPILFLSTAIMLAFSFFRVSELLDGKLSYDSTNWHWRILKKVFDVKGNLSLCAAFWMTVVITTVSVFILGAIVLVSAIITNGNGSVFLRVAKQTAHLLALMSSFVLPVALRAIWKDNKKVDKISLFLIITAVVGWFVVTPLYLFVYKDGLAMSAALLKYLWGVAGVFGITVLTVAIFGLFALLIKYLSSVSSDNLLKRLFSQVYNNLCPILHENSPANE